MRRSASPAGAVEVDGRGKWVTPGIIDVHSHLGDYPSPGTASHSDGNEATSPARPEVWAEHSVWPQDPGFSRALANGGVTALQVLPGSANLFGGRSVTLKNVPARTVQGMKFPGAPYGLKMACGENPKRVYGSKGNMPQTRMGNIAYVRQTWLKAKEYKRKWDAYQKNGGEMPSRDLANETLMGVLAGKIIVHNHCYRADEMAIMLDLAKEMGYKVGTFHHAVESYKIADLLREAGTCSAMWADWWGFKMESFDGIKENIPYVHNAGACAIVHSDDSNGIQRLNQEAAKALADGRRVGIADQRRSGLDLAVVQSGESARDRRQDRQPEARQDGRRRAVERQPVQHLHAARQGVDRRRLAVRRCQSAAAPGQRLRAWPAGRRGHQVKRLALLALLLASAPPAGGRNHRHHRRHGCAGRRVGADPGRNGRHPRRPHRRCRLSGRRSRRMRR